MKKYYLSSIVALFAVPVMTIAGELNESFKDFLKDTFWHHWLGKSMVVIILFVLSLELFHKILKKNETQDDERALSAITWVSVLGYLSIFFFFVYEYFKNI